MKHKLGTSHKDQLMRLNRIAGQVKGVAKMIEDQRYCVEILTQLKAINRALASVESSVIEEHLDHCVHSAIKGKNSRETDEMIQEIKTLLKSRLK